MAPPIGERVAAVETEVKNLSGVVGELKDTVEQSTRELREELRKQGLNGRAERAKLLIDDLGDDTTRKALKALTADLGDDETRTALTAMVRSRETASELKRPLKWLATVAITAFTTGAASYLFLRVIH